MRAEHLWSTERPRARASASRARPRPAGGSHERLPMSTSMCAMFSDSKMRPRIVLRQREHKVSIGQALSACDKMATVWPHAARCGGFEMPCVLRGWCGLCGAGGAALRGPYSILHFYTYRLTCASLIAFTRRSDTPSASRVALCPPRTRWDGTSKEPTRPATTGADALRESEWQWQRARGMRTVPPQVRTGRPSSVGKVEFLLIATSRSVQNRVPRIRS